MFVMLMACYIQSLNYKLANESLSFRSGAVEVSFVLGYEAKSPDIRFPTFRKKTVPSTSRVRRSKTVESRISIPLKMKALCSFPKSGTDYPVTCRQISEQRSPQNY